MSTAPLRRVARRETHSPRTVATVMTVALLLLGLLYIAAEIVLHLLDQPPLVVSPGRALAWLVALPTAVPEAALVASGIVAALLGLVLVVLAVTPGRLAKHELESSDRLVVVDNGVLASALAQHLSVETGIPRPLITVGVAHRTVDVTVRAESGVPVDAGDLKRIADAELDTYRLAPSVRTTVRVSETREKEFAP